MKPRVTCPVYYKVTYDRPKRAERTSFINSKSGRQIGKSVKVVVRKETLLVEIKIKVREICYYICYFQENSLLVKIMISGLCY